MNKNTTLVILTSLLLVVGFAYFFLSPKFGPQVELDRNNNQEPTTEATPDVQPNEITEEEAVKLAKEQLLLTEDTGLESEVISVDRQEFGDTSLGCPKQGEAYAQVITPGYTVILDLNGTRYDYRVSASGENVFMCEE